MNRRRLLAGAAASFGASYVTPFGSSSAQVVRGGEGKKMGVPAGSTILVAGAGIAGLASASMLREHGYRVVILEARDRIGGRIHTTHQFGVPIELGASWFHGGPQNPLRSIAKHNNVITRSTNYRNLLVYADGRKLTVPGLDPALCRFEKGLYGWRNRLSFAGAWFALHTGIGGSRTSAAVVVDRAGSPVPGSDDDVVVRLVRAALGSAYARPLDELSLVALLRESSTGGSEGGCVDGQLKLREEPFVLSGMNAVADAIGKNATVRLNEVVEHIAYRRGHVSIKTNRDTHEAAAAVITLPVGVLQAGQVTFDPPLGEPYRCALRRLQMGAYNKLAMEFPRAFWPDEADMIALLAPTTAVPFFVNMHLYTKKPILLGLAGGEAGIAFTRKPVSEIVNAVMRDLRYTFGSNVPEPVRVRATDWIGDPFARGSYSTVPLGATGREAYVLSNPIEDTIFLVGEATHPTDPATLHGAYWSGLRAAAQIAGRAYKQN